MRWLVRARRAESVAVTPVQVCVAKAVDCPDDTVFRLIVHFLM